jgi:hypothetical protein
MSPHSKPADEVFARGLISAETRDKLKSVVIKRGFSIHSELYAVLYVGILSLSTGLGILIYNHISSLAHILLMTAMALAVVLGFGWCFKRAKGYSPEKQESAGRMDDNVLLLSSLILVSLFSYSQIIFHWSGSAGLEYLFPALMCFCAAYYFDHLGVLSVSIASAGAFVGLAVSPWSKGMYTNFQTEYEVYAGLALAALFVVAGLVSTKKNWKAHFAFTWFNFALHMSFFASIAALFVVDFWLIPVPLIAFICWRAKRYAEKENSFYFFLVTVLYTFVAICCIYGRLILSIRIDSGEGILFISLLLLIFASVLVIHILKTFRKKRAV